MARRRRERMNEGKKNIIAGLIQEYDIKSVEDIQEALKDLLGGTIQEMMEAELDVPSQQKWTQKSFKKRNESYSFFCFRKTAAFIPRFA